MQRALLATFLFCISAVCASAKSNAIQDYYAAKKLAKQNENKAAYTLYSQAAIKSVTEGLPEYGFHAHHKAAFQAYTLSDYENCRLQALGSLAVWKKHTDAPWSKESNAKTIRIELLGLLDRCAIRNLKIAEGWNYNRQAIVVWKSFGYHAGSDQLLNPKLISRFPQRIRSSAWRLIGREADYLHLVGRSTEAVALLEAAIASSSLDLASSDVVAQLYSRKLLGSLANIQSFIGYKAKALELYNREAKAIMQAKTHSRRSYLTSRLNYLDTLTSLEGASESTVEETNSILKEARDKNYPQTTSFERMAVQILNAKTTSAERQASLEALAQDNSNLRDAVEVFFTTRGVLFEKSKRGEPGLDTAFNEFLIQTQQSGDKKAEPRIYRVYGDWLVSQSRFGEAINVYQESLRMVEKFEWVPSVPMLLAKLGSTYLASNQPDAARRTWLRMDQFIRSHPELPTYAIIKARRIQCYALLKAGLIKEGKLIAKASLEFGTTQGTSAYWLDVLHESYIDQYLKKLNELRDQKADRQDQSKGSVFIHPIALNSLSTDTQGARASFYLINRSSKPVSGSLVVRGHGVKLAEDTKPDAPSFSCSIDQPVNSIRTSLTTEGGSMLEIPFAASLLQKNSANASYQISWKPDQGKETQVTWGVYPAGSKLNYAIMESAVCAPSPFIGVPVLHHIQFPDNEDKPHGFRLRSETIIRIEYRSPGTGKLIAVDNNGNGLFTDAGDFLATPENNPEKPISPTVTPSVDKKPTAIEVWTYPRRNTPWDQEIFLHLELNHPQNGWTEYSKNVIRPTATKAKP